MSETSRRQVLRGTVGLSLLAAGGTGTGTAMGATRVMTEAAAARGAFEHQHASVPLPFKAGAAFLANVDWDAVGARMAPSRA